MFDRIFSHFDASLDFDFFDQTRKSKALADNTPQIIMDQAAELWSMWVKESIVFQYDSNTNRGHSTNWKMLNLMERTGYPNDSVNREYVLCSRDPNNVLSDQLIDPYSDKSRVSIPAHFATKAEDFAVATDCVAAAGIEALELQTTVIQKLKNICLKDLWANMHLAGNSLSGLTVEKQKLNVEMFSKVWGAIELQVIRSRVLQAWPGWREMFENKDAAITDSKTAIQKFVNGKDNSASEFERFCTAMAYNINMLQDKVRLPNEPNFQRASDHVRSVWLNILQTQDPSSRVIQMSDMFEALRRILSMDKDSSKKDRVRDVNACDEPLVHPDDAKKPDYRMSASKLVIPQAEAQSKTQQVIVRADLKNSSDVSKENHSPLMYLHKGYKDTYKKSDELRREAATAAWQVALPPASEHGQLSGSLDEGALHKFAAWGDSNIFDQPPEAGAGDVALAILIDCSGSMQGTKLEGAKQFADAIWHGVGNRPNVKLTQFAFLNDRTCNMLRLDHPDHIDKLICGGGTPIAVSVSEACRYLMSNFPNATKGIIVLTDGESSAHSSCATAKDSNSGPSTMDCINTTATVIRELPIPVVGVGFGQVDRNVMFQQFGAGKYFMVNQPQEAVKVVAEVLQSATI